MHKKLQLENISTNLPDNFDIQSYVFPEGEKPENGFNVTISYEGSPSVVPGETKTVRFAIKNNTKGRWRISASVLPRSDAFCACPQKSELTLESSEEASLSFNIKNNADKLDFINRFDLIVTRLNGSSPWIEYRAPFTLLRSSHWQLDGVNKVIDGTTVRFEDNGETLRTAKAKIVNPFKRKVKLMCSTVAPVEVALNEKPTLKQKTTVTICLHIIAAKETAPLFWSLARVCMTSLLYCKLTTLRTLSSPSLSSQLTKPRSRAHSTDSLTLKSSK